MSDSKAASATIDEYIAQCDPKRQEVLQKVRETICAAAPDAAEKISYGMPTFWQGRNLIHFAAMKGHLGIYPGASGVAAFEARLAAEGFKTSKGAVQIPWDAPAPYELIAEMTRFRVAEETAG